MPNPLLTNDELLIEQQTHNASYITAGSEFDQWKMSMQKIAANTPLKRRAISVKIPSTEIDLFKINAAKEGLKYQTKLNQLIYLYNRSEGVFA